MDRLTPFDLYSTAEFVADSIKRKFAGSASRRLQVQICEKIILPLATDEELRRGLAAVIGHARDGIETMHTVNHTEPGSSPEEKALIWLQKLIGAAPL